VWGKLSRQVKLLAATTVAVSCLALIILFITQRAQTTGDWLMDSNALLGGPVALKRLRKRQNYWAQKVPIG
jgi:hypothetical protein